MFAINTAYKDGFSIVILKDLVSETSAEIIPSCGGILHAFNVLHQNDFINVIDNYDSKDDFEQQVTSKGFKSCKLSPFACRIKNATYQFGETRYRIKKFLLGKNAIHGLIYDAVFSIVQQYANEENATLVLQHAYRGSDAGYPFSFDCLITYQLIHNNELVITTEIINRDEMPIPIQDGWHPYFTLGKKIDDLELSFQSKEQVEFDEQLMPSGNFIEYADFISSKKINNTFLDNCFTLDFTAVQPLCVLKDSDNKIQVEIRPDKSYPYLQLYTPPHRKSIAIENLSAPPDTFNNGIDLIILPAGNHAIFNTSYKISSIT